MFLFYYFLNKPNEDIKHGYIEHILQTYEKKIRDSEKNIKRLENNNDLLRLEMESRSV